MKPVVTQVVPQERASLLSTDASSSSVASEASDLLLEVLVKDRRTGDYGSTPSILTDTDVVVSDQILVSAVANLSTAVRRAHFCLRDGRLTTY